jgi:Flp pilus assembly protein TadG
MRRWRLWASDDEGSAALEFITAGILLLVPLVYLVISLGAVQEQTLGAEAAARHTARAISQAPDADTATARADAVLASIRGEYGMNAVDVSLSCTPAGGECPRSGATVIVTVSTRVSLPFMPSLAGLDRVTSIPVTAAAAQKMSTQWGTE